MKKGNHLEFVLTTVLGRRLSSKCQKLLTLTGVLALWLIMNESVH